MKTKPSDLRPNPTNSFGQLNPQNFVGFSNPLQTVHHQVNVHDTSAVIDPINVYGSINPIDHQFGLMNPLDNGDLKTMDNPSLWQPRSAKVADGPVAISSDSVTCHCYKLLDPYPTSMNRGSASLSHYCRVCNIQLNSCKQALIHVEGKKHSKRLEYLKICVETSAQAESGANSSVRVSQQPIQPPQPQPAQMQQQPVLSSFPTAPSVQPQQFFQPQAFAQTPMVNYTSSPCSSTYYYPNYQTYAQPTMQTTAQYVSTPQVTMSQPLPVQTYQALNHYTIPQQTTLHYYKPTEMNYPPYNLHLSQESAVAQVIPNQDSSRQVSFNPLAKAFTVKSEVTNSDKIKTRNSSKDSAEKKKSESRKFHFCNLCQLSFSSQAVLETHLNGSKHVRRVKSEPGVSSKKDLARNQVVKQGPYCKGGPPRCEVCDVTVNSIQQLQAHVEGHKHRTRCFRRGLHQDITALLPTPASSTPPSTAPSECSSGVPNFSGNQKSAEQSNPRGSNAGNETKKAGSLLGRPTPGAGLLGPSPAGFVQPAFLRRTGDGLLPLPSKVLMAANVNRQARNSNAAPKSKARKVSTRSSRNLTKENHDSTTESDEPASNGNVANNMTDSKDTSSSSSATSCGDTSKHDTCSTSDEAKESENDSETPKDSTNEIDKMKFSCEKCNITMVSSAQLVQHLKSSKHNVISNDDNLNESPMLNMFLETLQTPKKCRIFSSDKDEEGESSNTEVER